MFTRDQKVRKPNTGSAGQADISVPDGGVFPITPVHHQAVSVQSMKVAFDAFFHVTAAAGGNADYVSLKLLTLPPGRKRFLASVVTIDRVTTDAGLSVATAAYWLSRTPGGAEIAGDVLGDGTLAAGATETGPSVSYGGTLNDSDDGILGAAAGESTDIYFDVEGTFTHATLTALKLRVAGTVELFFIDLGAAA
jgi:hypothetical protein